MRFKLRKKLLLFLSATLFIVTGVLGVHVAKTAQAEDVSAPVLTVEKNNLSYSDSLYILYAVSNEGFDRTQHEIKMLFWENEQKEYIIGTQDYEQTTEGYVEVDEKDCLVFYSDGIAAKEMTTDIYARACVEVDGVTYYSEVQKFSVLEYVYTAHEIGGLTEEQENLFDAMLTYGTAAQILFDYKTDRLANEIYYKITVEKPEAAIVKAEVKSEKLSAWVEINRDIYPTARLYAAGYNEEDEMVFAKELDIDNPTLMVPPAKYYKLFLWDGIKPMCNSYTVIPKDADNKTKDFGDDNFDGEADNM